MLDRRTLLTGLSAIIAAPAIVRASSLMAIKALPEVGYMVAYIGNSPFAIESTREMADRWGWPFISKVSIHEFMRLATRI